MRDRDTADSPLASHWPHIEEQLDTLPDVLKEKIAALQCPLPRSFQERVQQFFAVLGEALKEANLAEAAARGSDAGTMPELINGLRILADDSSNKRVALRAACLLKQLGLDRRSDQELAEAYGVTTRATPHTIRRTIEKRTGLRTDSSKSDKTRERCRRHRTGKRRERLEFRGAEAWQRARTIPLTLPPSS